jgi:hypothetical protein
MSERKPVTINFFRIESADEAMFADLKDKLASLEDGGMAFGFFDGRSCELMFKVHKGVQQKSGRLFMVSIVKEKVFTPVRFDREGGIMEAEPTLGDISYALIDTMSGAIAMLSGRASQYADFIRWLTGEAFVSLTPIYDQKAIETVMQWEVYRRLNVAVEAPAADYTDKVLDSPIGSNFVMLDTLKGLKIDISVSMGRGEGSLDRHFVRQFIRSMIEEGFAGKLKVSGKNFDERATKEIDIYVARVRHKTTVVVAGTHIPPDEARAVLYEAYQTELERIAYEEEHFNA